jgi:signal peptidase I
MINQRWVKDNLEAIAIAVVMALVIRQFAVEAFKIPTESMAPTLFGERRGLSGDRILVDKIGPMLHGYQRFDVVVFKYPVNASKNYIKRLIGLPGEKLSIRDGDIWIDGKIARKPEDVQEVLFFQICPAEGETRREVGDRWHLPRTGWKRLDEGDFEATVLDDMSFALFARKVKDVCPWAGEGDGVYAMGDVRLRVTVKPLAPGGTVILRIIEGGVTNDLVLAVGSGDSRLSRGEERVPLPGIVLSPGEETEVSFTNVDDAILVEVGGTRFRYEYETSGDVNHATDAVSFGVEQASVRFTEPTIWRDIHYEKKGRGDEITIPGGHYFMLGDNSRRSKDSRVWAVRIYEMKDGTTFRYDDTEMETRPRAGPEPGTLVFLDQEGIVRTIREADVARERSEAAPFVPERNMVGRAFFIFWPLKFFPAWSKKASKDQFRLRFIR